MENFFREHLSAKLLSPVGIQEARNFIECLNMCKCNPFAPVFLFYMPNLWLSPQKSGIWGDKWNNDILGEK